MTTILVDRKARIMAADSQSVMGSNFRFKGAPKIRRHKSKVDELEWLYASAGDSEAGVFFDAWFEDQLDNPQNKNHDLYPKDGEFNAVAMNELGEVFFYGAKGCPVPIKERFFALGSGGDYALGAIYGLLYKDCKIQDPICSARTSVRIATLLDVASGGRIQVEGFGNRGKRSNRTTR